MAKKKGRSVTTKNPEMIGGKNSLPKTNKGTVDLKKMAKIAEKRKSMTQVEKALGKPKPKIKQEISKKPITGISKLKSAATKTQKSAPPKQVAKSQPSAKNKGISKLKATIPTPKPKTVKAPVKKGPSKGR